VNAAKTNSQSKNYEYKTSQVKTYEYKTSSQNRIGECGEIEADHTPNTPTFQMSAEDSSSFVVTFAGQRLRNGVNGQKLTYGAANLPQRSLTNQKL